MRRDDWQDPTDGINGLVGSPRLKGWLSESLIAGMFVLAVMLVLLGLRVAGGSGRRYQSHTAASVSASANAGAWLIEIGLGVGVAALVIGLALAFVPRWMTRRRNVSARVHSRYVLHPGSDFLDVNGDILDEEARAYLRLQFLDGSEADFACPADVYRSVFEGQTGLAVVDGRYLLEFRTPQR